MMTNDLTNSIDRYFQPELLATLSLENGIPQDTLLKASRYISLLAAHQIKFKLEHPDSAMVTYRFARVAARSRVSLHLRALYHGDSRYQGIANMTRIIYSGDLSAITQMVEQQFSFSKDVSTRMIVMSASSMLAFLGETLVERKMKQAAFTQYVNEQIPLLDACLSGGTPFPLEYWEKRRTERSNAQFRAEKRRQMRPAKKSSSMKVPVKLFITIVSFLSGLRLILP